jgi:hypothetical protein
MAGPGHARGTQEPMHGGPAHGESVLGLELLGQMGRVQAGVLAPREGQDLRLAGGGEPASGGPTPVPVDQRLAALRAQAGEQPPHVPLGEAKNHRGLGPGQAMLADEPERVIALEIALTHQQEPRTVGHRASWIKSETLAPSLFTLRKLLNS